MDDVVLWSLGTIFIIMVAWCGSFVMYDINTQHVFTGTPNVGKMGEDNMAYGWLCYPKTPHNIEVNKEAHWAVNERGICEWR